MDQWWNVGPNAIGAGGYMLDVGAKLAGLPGDLEAMIAAARNRTAGGAFRPPTETYLPRSQDIRRRMGGTGQSVPVVEPALDAGRSTGWDVPPYFLNPWLLALTLNQSGALGDGNESQGLLGGMLGAFNSRGLLGRADRTPNRKQETQ